MKEAIRLVRIDFDNLENSYEGAITEREIGIFESGDHLTPYGKIALWFSEQSLEKQYTGYNHQVYPQWRLETKKLI